MIPQAELDRLRSNRPKGCKEVRSFQYKLKVDLIWVNSKENWSRVDTLTNSLRYIDLRRPQQVEHSTFLADLTHMFAEQDFNCRCFEENKTGKIAHDLSEISYDKSANWTETLAKPPKPLANWSSVKRLLGETTGIPTVFSRAFDRFFNEMVFIIKEIFKLQRVAQFCLIRIF